MEWIKCSERLPEEYDNVLVIVESKHIYVGYIDKKPDYWICFCECSDGSYIKNPTHWMPLPEIHKIEL